MRTFLNLFRPLKKMSFSSKYFQITIHFRLNTLIKGEESETRGALGALGRIATQQTQVAKRTISRVCLMDR